MMQLPFYFPCSFLFKCKGDDGKGSKLSFELEICSVPGLENMVGKCAFLYFFRNKIGEASANSDWSSSSPLVASRSLCLHCLLLSD